MLAGYWHLIKAKVRPDQTQACMHVNRERRQAWAEQSKVNLDRYGAISLESQITLHIVKGSLLVFTERHMHGLSIATVSSVSPYSSGSCR